MGTHRRPRPQKVESHLDIASLFKNFIISQRTVASPRIVTQGKGTVHVKTQGNTNGNKRDQAYRLGQPLNRRGPFVRPRQPSTSTLRERTMLSHSISAGQEQSRIKLLISFIALPRPRSATSNPRPMNV